MAKRRFYRPPPPLSDLGRIVWSGKAGKAVAEFGREDNQFFTENNEIAEYLLKLGYIEVGLEDERPPYLPEMGPKEVGDVKINPKGFDEQHEIQKAKRELLLKEKEDDSQPPVPKKEKLPETSTTSPSSTSTYVSSKSPAKAKPSIKKKATISSKKSPATKSKSRKVLRRRGGKEV